MYLVTVLANLASFYAIQSFIRITGEKTNTENKFVLIGSQAVFKCKFEVSYWFHTDPKKNSSQEIYDGDSVVEKFRKHFEISNSSEEYVLKILDATFEHAGIYACVSSNKTERRFNLIMIDERINCITSQNSSWISMTNVDNKDIAVNCSLNSSSSCGVAPLLINPDSEQNLSTTDIGFGKGYLWFKIINEDFETANYKLNFVFECNISGHQSYYIYHTNYTLQLSLKDLPVKFCLKFGVLLSIVSFLGFCFLAALIHRFKRKKKNNQKERPSIRNEPLPDVPEMNKPNNTGLSDIYDEVFDGSSKSIRNSIMAHFRKKNSYKKNIAKSNTSEVSAYDLESPSP